MSNVCLAAIAPALWRYIDQRFKTTQQAYWHVLTIEAAKDTKLEYPARDDGLTHAGSVAYRITADGKPEYLLVTASKNREQWVLPKGHIEYGENPRETAVREVREESGHWARIEKWLADEALGSGNDAPRVRWFLMCCGEESKDRREEGRQQQWLSHGKAKQHAKFDETHVLLDQAAQAKDQKQAARPAWYMNVSG